MKASTNTSENLTCLAQKPRLAVSDYLFLPDNHQYVRISRENILYIEADGSYVMLVMVVGPPRRISGHLGQIAEQLSGDANFMRVSRSHILNLRHIVTIGRGVVGVNSDQLSEHHPANGYEIKVSRDQRQTLLKILPVVLTKNRENAEVDSLEKT
jgi:two-component system LytT family response regulator